MIFTRAFWTAVLEAALVGGSSAFVGVWAASQGGTTISDLKAAGIAFGTGALYAVVKAIGGLQTKVTGKAPAAFGEKR